MDIKSGDSLAFSDFVIVEFWIVIGDQGKKQDLNPGIHDSRLSGICLEGSNQK